MYLILFNWSVLVKPVSHIFVVGAFSSFSNAREVTFCNYKTMGEECVAECLVSQIEEKSWFKRIKL